MDGISFLVCGVCKKPCEEHEFLVRRDTKKETRRKVCEKCRREQHVRRASAGSKRGCNDSFWDRVNKNGPIVYPHLTACWIWTGSKVKKGYGVWSHPSNSYQSMLAHRFVWTITYGEIPEGVLVLHKCDNPPCVNPSHLFLGSYVDNVQDCIRKGRFSYSKKITEAQVREIRELRRAGALLREIAAKFQVTRGNISMVLSGKIWGHVQ